MKLTITNWKNLVDPQGTETELTWADLVALLTQPTEAFRGDRSHPGWSPATFRGRQRALAGVESVFAICLDYDAGETLEAAERLWGGFTGLIQTTRKHTPEAPRFRVVLPLSRPVSWFEYTALWLRVNGYAEFKLDPAPSDSSRFWFLPAASETFESRVFTGGLLDVDEWLRKPDPTPKPVAALPQLLRQPRVQSQDQQFIERRARAYLSKMDGGVSGSGGHVATWSAAVAMARGFALSASDTFRLLWNDYNPRCVPPWSEKEIWHKVKGAAKAEKVPLGCLLESDRRDFDMPAEPQPPLKQPGEITEADYDHETGEVYQREPGDDTEEIEKELAEAVAEARAEPAQAVPPDPLKQYGVITLHSMFQAVIDEARKGKGAKGYATGISEIDEAIGGLRLGNITLLAAQTSWGKSSFGIMTMVNNLGTDARPLIVSVEDKLVLYSKRVTAKTCKINALALRDNDLERRDFDRIYQAMADLPNDPVFIDAVGKSVEWVAEAITACCKHLGTKLVICDYVQRFKTSKHAADKKNQVTYVGETLSDAIKNGGAAGLILSQLKRTQGKEPTMDDVKESGDLENMAEHVMIGWREGDKENGRFNPDAQPLRKWNIPKNKDGPIVSKWGELKFDETTASFMPDVDWRMEQRDREGLSAFDDVADNV